MKKILTIVIVGIVVLVVIGALAGGTSKPSSSGSVACPGRDSGRCFRADLGQAGAHAASCPSDRSQTSADGDAGARSRQGERARRDHHGPSAAQLQDGKDTRTTYLGPDTGARVVLDFYLRS